MAFVCGTGLADAMEISTASEITANSEPLIRILFKLLRIDLGCSCVGKRDILPCIHL